MMLARDHQVGHSDPFGAVQVVGGPTNLGFGFLSPINSRFVVQHSDFIDVFTILANVLILQSATFKQCAKNEIIGLKSWAKPFHSEHCSHLRKRNLVGFRHFLSADSDSADQQRDGDDRDSNHVENPFEVSAVNYASFDKNYKLEHSHRVPFPQRGEKCGGRTP